MICSPVDTEFWVHSISISPSQLNLHRPRYHARQLRLDFDAKGHLNRCIVFSSLPNRLIQVRYLQRTNGIIIIRAILVDLDGSQQISSCFAWLLGCLAP